VWRRGNPSPHFWRYQASIAMTCYASLSFSPNSLPSTNVLVIGAVSGPDCCPAPLAG
jgi:hypothetical protein